MKKRILIALALCMALGTACGKKEVEEEKTLRSVEVTTVGKGDIASEFSYTGKAAPAKEVSVVPTVPGKVLSFNYDVGDKVGQGAVLFTVDSTDLQNNMRSLQASYNAAKLGRDNAKSTYDSNKLLYDEEIISKNEFDQIKPITGYPTRPTLSRRIHCIKTTSLNLPPANHHSFSSPHCTKPQEPNKRKLASLSAATCTTNCFRNKKPKA